METLPERSQEKSITEVRHSYAPEDKPKLIKDYARLTQYISEMRSLAQASKPKIEAETLKSLLDEQQAFADQGLKIIESGGNRPPAMRRHDIVNALENIRNSANLPIKKFVITEFNNEIH